MNVNVESGGRAGIHDKECNGSWGSEVSGNEGNIGRGCISYKSCSKGQLGITILRLIKPNYNAFECKILKWVSDV